MCVKFRMNSIERIYCIHRLLFNHSKIVNRHSLCFFASTRKPRPPIVTIMGHVDHGKTTLLDYLRNSAVAAGEAGGITQHIGSFNISLSKLESKTKSISPSPSPLYDSVTFLDTPGHAAFQAMRRRGASITDIIVLVIAIDDGIQPQTLESISLAKELDIPIIVALNKVDKCNSQQLERIKQELLKHGIIIEEFGGEIQSIPISGLTGKNVDRLLESIIALAEILELSTFIDSPITGFIIESKQQIGHGPVCTLIVQQGILSIGQKLCLVDNSTISCRVRSIIDSNGKYVNKALPSHPVQVSGWNDIPIIGSQCVETRTNSSSNEQNDRIVTDTNTSNLPSLRIMLLCDVVGSLEAIQQALKNIPQTRAIIYIISQRVTSMISPSDIEMARLKQSKVITFHLPPVSKSIQKLIEKDEISIHSYNIIYQLVEDVKKWLLELIPNQYSISIMGIAQILQIFHSQDDRGKRIAGCKVLEGAMSINTLGFEVQVKRSTLENDIVVHNTTKPFKSLRQGKEQSTIVRAGMECGIMFSDDFDFQIGDRVIILKKTLISKEL